MSEFATLYKRTGRSTQVWQVHTYGADVVVTRGKLGGKQVSTRTTAKTKNKGRANQTSPEEQARKEALARWTKQVEREDYAIKPEWSNQQLRPMLALDATKVGHRINWKDAVAQPKLDGLRLIYGDRHPDKPVGKPELLTRKGDSYNIPHLLPALLDLEEAISSLSLGGYGRMRGIDGEVYVHGMPLGDIVSLARRPRSESTALQYHLFDLDIPGWTFERRYLLLRDAFFRLPAPARRSLRLVPVNKQVHGYTLDRVTGAYMEAGYEGTIIRHASGLYKKGRSANLFKYKKFKDEEAVIFRVWEDEFGNGMFTVRRENGVEVDVTPKRTHAERKRIVRHPEEYVGKLLTVKYQAETPDGSLQFPVGLDVRDYE